MEKIIQPLDEIAQLEVLVVDARKSMLLIVQEHLDEMAGKEIPESMKQEVLKRIQNLLKSVGAHVVCPKTNKPGNLRLKQAGADKNKKTFAVEIMQRGRQTNFFSSVKFPKLELTLDKPADGRTKS